jgi:mRNA-degrading endonuclease toxin of MazEF toxin-antitoxin module
VLTRNEAIPVLRTVLVAPMPRMVRDIPSEVPLGTAQGLPIDRAATMDNILAFPKSMLTRRMGAIALDAQWRICDALAAATDC